MCHRIHPISDLPLSLSNCKEICECTDKENSCTRFKENKINIFLIFFYENIRIYKDIGIIFLRGEMGGAAP
jgi:hypothetical protein